MIDSAADEYVPISDSWELAMVSGERSVKLEDVGPILGRAREAAIDYYRLTGKPLGITGEYGEYVAAERLGLELAEARTAGYDATDSAGRRIQIKARSIPREKKLVGQRLGSIRLDHEWDVVLLVVMDELFELRWIFEAERPAIEVALKAPGSKARNERGALSLAKFKSIGRQIWPTAG
ncbi:MAG: hypothetical protein KDC43_00100 [Saprospiraceae bacterium]|nr:hypothetical protein [Saprospiraceae bacterium]